MGQVREVKALFFELLFTLNPVLAAQRHVHSVLLHVVVDATVGELILDIRADAADIGPVSKRRFFAINLSKVAIFVREWRLDAVI